jgi:hypothetical protein
MVFENLLKTDFQKITHDKCNKYRLVSTKSINT